MKKSFPLHLPEKEDSRVVEAVKLTLTKYVKRERRKKLPEGVDFWDFSCKIGADRATAAALLLPDVPKAVDTVALAGGAEVYVEIEACPGYRPKKPSRSPYPEQNS
jgi:hypothetical protein